jgi:predicted nucleic acid-binding protein
MKYCVDTSFAIDILRGTPEAGAKLREIEAAGEIAMASVSVYELLHVSGDLTKERMAERDGLIRTFRVLPLDERAARKAAEVHSALDRSGVSIEIRDLLIGAVALANNSALVTRNEKDFNKMPELNVVSW